MNRGVTFIVLILPGTVWTTILQVTSTFRIISLISCREHTLCYSQLLSRTLRNV